MFKLFRNNNKVQLINKRKCVYNNYRVISTNNILKNSELAAGYVPHEVENVTRIQGYFDNALQSEKIYSLILPPPNITGTLHLGHALTVTIQDVLIRWNRMRGFNVSWIPGIDHAGIATQVVVEKKLWQENQQTRHDLGRQLFEKEIWKWKYDKADIIRQQLQQLGASLDWSNEIFTMDPKQSQAVTRAFIKLYECGLIYRSDYLVNWSCVLQSAISDIEVEHLQVSGPTFVPVPGYSEPVEFGILTEFAYKLCDSDEEIVVSTTRPETLFGDVAVAVNPKDDRYSSYIGRKLWHPFINEEIPVICDDFVDPAFGTGAVKVTPGHDRDDFEVGKRHGLKILSVINERGNLSAACGEFSGVPRFDGRNIIVGELARLNLLRGRQHHEMIVPICSRSRDVIEFLVKPQWFVKCQEMARRAVEDVEKGNLSIDPPHFEKIWFNWLENIRDWCVSRQLWWGHRVPAYSCWVRGESDRKCWVAADSPEAARSEAALRFSTSKDNVIAEQDEDVLDTWFSSALLPFSVFGWPQQTSNLVNYYPLSLMETGHDILFFWVARMVMLGTQLTGRLPFNKILLHGIICDSNGRKMSKSLGNVVAPEDVIKGTSLKELEHGSKASHAAGILSTEELKKAIEGQKKMFPEGIPECGADALRFTLCSHNIKNHFINFDVQECKVNKFFGNKIWQATKFTNKWMETVAETQNLKQIEIERLPRMDKWILSRLSYMVDVVNESLDKSEFHVATSALKNFLYYDFCDVYLETTKRGLRCPDSSVASGHCFVLTYCLDTGLRCLAPFMPGLAQHLHENLSLHPSVPTQIGFPQDIRFRNDDLERDVEIMQKAVVALRRLKKIFNLTSKHKTQVHLISNLLLFKQFSDTIADLSACNSVTVMDVIDPLHLTNETVSDTVGSYGKVYLLVPEDIRRAFEGDIHKLEKKRGKLEAELKKIQRIVSAEGYQINVSGNVKESNLKKIASLEEKISRIEYMKSFCRS